MNLKGISIMVGVAAVILLVVLLPIKPGDVPPAIQDTPGLGEDADIGLGGEDVPAITESVTVTSETTPDFYVDENGTRHYIISAEDTINPP